MERIDIERNVFERIAADRSEKIGIFRKVISYIAWSRESEESCRLGNMIGLLSVLIGFSIIRGIIISDIDLTINGIHNIMHLSAFIFSLFALLISKRSPDMHFTYGYTRYETLAAFTNCLFLNISALFLVLSSVHFLSHSDHRPDEQV